MRLDVSNWIKDCVICQKIKLRTGPMWRDEIQQHLYNFDPLDLCGIGIKKDLTFMSRSYRPVSGLWVWDCVPGYIALGGHCHDDLFCGLLYIVRHGRCDLFVVLWLRLWCQGRYDLFVDFYYETFMALGLHSISTPANAFISLQSNHHKGKRDCLLSVWLSLYIFIIISCSSVVQYVKWLMTCYGCPWLRVQFPFERKMSCCVI